MLVSARAGICLSLISVIGLFLSPLPSVAQVREVYLEHGQPVSKSTYDVNVLVTQGMQLFHANKVKDAADKFGQAVSVAPDYPDAHHDYGLALAKLGQNEQAIAQFKEAIRLNPNLSGSVISLGSVYASSGRMNEAIETYKLYVQKFPSAPDVAAVNGLIQGLEREAAQHGAASTAALPPAVGDDYLVDVTPEGLRRWPAQRMPVRVFIHDGSSVPGYSAKYTTILKKSFEDWSAASKGLVTFKFVTSSANADVDCIWTADPKLLANQADAGEVREALDSAGLVHATLKLSTAPVLSGEAVTDNSIRMWCLHEIGHVLGFSGHTKSPGDAMFFTMTLTPIWTDLTARDANTVQRLYGR